MVYVQKIRLKIAKQNGGAVAGGLVGAVNVMMDTRLSMEVWAVGKILLINVKYKNHGRSGGAAAAGGEMFPEVVKRVMMGIIGNRCFRGGGLRFMIHASEFQIALYTPRRLWERRKRVHANSVKMRMNYLQKQGYVIRVARPPES